MLSKNFLYYGKEDALPTRIPLRAGPLTLVYEAGDLRYIRLGEVEILRRIYVAVRDQNWGTISAVYSDVGLDIRRDSFRIAYDVENRRDEVDFAWHGEITGEVDGTIRFSMDGAARTTFLKNRIGFCILHPNTAAGAACVIEHVDGTTERAPLPLRINPDQPVMPFAELRRLAHEVKPGVWADVEMTGDTFELEDQRNWTDASFKTYCTPQRLRYPVRVEAGAQIQQVITVTVKDERPKLRNRGYSQQKRESMNNDEAVPLNYRIDLHAAPQQLPRVGLGMASHGEPTSERACERLSALQLNHLRVDLILAENRYENQLRRAQEQADALGVRLEIALLLSEDAQRELELFKSVVGKLQPPISTWLIYPRKENYTGGSPTARLVELARRSLEEYGGKFAAGTITDFIFLQRNPPPVQLLDAVTLQMNPQPHAFDNASLVETLQGQAAVIDAAQSWAEGLPVMVSPVTLKPRFNPYTTASPPPVPPGELPPQVDPRQMSLFGAGWTIGSFKYLAESGVRSVTYYEMTGWRGVMETEAGSPVPDKFHSFPGGVYPIYHVFADVGEFAGGTIIPSWSSDPLSLNGIVLQQDNRVRVLLASFSDERRTLTVHNLGSHAVVHILDETNVEHAMQSPEAFRAEAGQLLETTDGSLELALLPFGVAKIDYDK